LLSCSSVHVAVLFLYWFIEQINDDTQQGTRFELKATAKNFGLIEEENVKA